MFTTTLFKVLNSAHMVTMNDYCLDDAELIPQAAPTNIRLALTDGENTELEFADQVVTVNEVGEFYPYTVKGELVGCAATVEKPLTEADLIK